MELLGKHLLFKNEWYSEHHGYDCVWTTLRRINRETKTQYISDTQRMVIDWDKEPYEYKWFHITAKRFRKKKIEKYIDNVIDDLHGEIERLKSDVEFDDMFTVIDVTNSMDLHMHHSQRVMDSYHPIKKFINKKRTKFPCYQDLSSPTAMRLNNIFCLPVYEVCFMFNEVTGKHLKFDHRKECDYNRNLIFHQLTVGGDDKKIITDEENEGNQAIFIWVFEDRIVYKDSEGRSEW